MEIKQERKLYMHFLHKIRGKRGISTGNDKKKAGVGSAGYSLTYILQTNNG